MPDGFTVPGHLVEFYPTGHTKLTLPTTGTLATLAGTETLAGKTLTTPAITLLTETVAATNVITAAESGKVFFLSHATEFASTLPAPAAGLNYSFIVAAAPSGASYTIVSDGVTQNVIHGVAVSAADAGGSVSSTAGTAVDVITFVDGQAKIGDRVDLVCDGTYWYAMGVCSDEDAITFS